jgi:hypothetical protein
VPHQGANEPIDALRCSGCGRLWVSVSAQRMIRNNEGCLSCGEPVEPVVVDKQGVRPARRDRIRGESNG